mmetsp:Transcript_89725/g.192334  ORF Transcript_89725/g.192334 Transcript_89725/m.192334 type:complete len:221 (+) Transcript_89725:453-1115(+)
MHLLVRAHCLRLLQPPQEFVHARHDERMRRKGADDIGHARGLGGIAARHEVLRATDDAHRQASSKRLSIANDVRLDVVGALPTPRVEAEASVDLVEDKHDAGLLACGPQGVEPLLIAWRWSDLAVVGGEDGIARGRLVQVEALKDIDEHRSDLALAGLDDLQRERAHIFQAEDVVGDTLVTHHGLHAVPPAVVGTAEGHDKGLLGVETSDPHRRHDSLCA